MEKPVRLLYIAGPYTAAKPWFIQRNIYDALDAAAEVVMKFGALGVYPMVPHANTMHFDELQPGKYFLKGTTEMLRRCDMILMLPKWEVSSGATTEHDIANSMKIPIFYDVMEIGPWLEIANCTAQPKPPTELSEDTLLSALRAANALLAEATDERAALAKQVRELQANGTKLVEERRVSDEKSKRLCTMLRCLNADID